MAATALYEVMTTYANCKYLLGGYTMNSLPGRTLDMYFYGKQSTEIVKHKKLTTRLLVREALKLSIPGLYVQQIHAVRCIQFHCAGLCFLLTLYKKGAYNLGEGIAIAMTDL